MASVGKQFSFVLEILPCGELWKAGVGGALESIDGRKILSVGNTRHAGDVVMAANVKDTVAPDLRKHIVDLHHWKPVVVIPSFVVVVWVVFAMMNRGR